MWHIFHRWETIVSDGHYLYQQCKKCQKRGIKGLISATRGYQPIPPVCEEWVEIKLPPRPSAPPPPPSSST